MPRERLEVKIKVDDAERALRALRAQFSATDRRVLATNRALLAAQGRFTKVGVSALRSSRSVQGFWTAFGGAIVIGRSLQVLASFERKMAEVRAITIRAGDSVAEQAAKFDQLSAAAQRAGANTEFTATQAAEALLILGRAGFEATEAVAALEPTLDLALVSGEGLESTAQQLAATLRQFGLEAEQASRVADSFAVTSSQSATTVTQLSEALKDAGPAAASLNISVEQTNAILGALADAGIRGGRAGRAFRSVIQALISPTEKAKIALQAMGLSAREVDPRIVGLSKAMSTLGKASLNLQDSTDVFQRRFATMALVVSQATEKVAGLTQAQIAGAGEAARQAAIIENNLTGSYRQLLSALQDVIVVLGDGGLTQTLTSFTRALRDNVRELAAWLREGTNARDLITEVQIALIAVATLALPAFTAAVVGATKATAAFTAAILLNPIGRIAVGITAVISALFALRKELGLTGEAGKGLAGFFRGLGGLFEFFFNQARGVKAVVEVAFGLALDAIKGTLTLLGRAIRVFGLTVASVFGPGLKEAVAQFADFFGVELSVVRKVLALVKLGFDDLKQGASNALTAITDFMRPFLGTLRTAVELIGRLSDFGVIFDKDADFFQKLEAFQRLGNGLDEAIVAGAKTAASKNPFQSLTKAYLEVLKQNGSDAAKAYLDALNGKLEADVEEAFEPVRSITQASSPATQSEQRLRSFIPKEFGREGKGITNFSPRLGDVGEVEERRNSVDNLIRSLRQEVAVSQELGEARAVLAATNKLLNTAQNEGISTDTDKFKEQLATVVRLTKELFNLDKARKLDEGIESLEFSAEISGLSKMEQAIARFQKTAGKRLETADIVRIVQAFDKQATTRFQNAIKALDFSVLQENLSEAERFIAKFERDNETRLSDAQKNRVNSVFDARAVDQFNRALEDLNFSTFQEGLSEADQFANRLEKSLGRVLTAAEQLKVADAFDMRALRRANREIEDLQVDVFQETLSETQRIIADIERRTGKGLTFVQKEEIGRVVALKNAFELVNAAVETLASSITGALFSIVDGSKSAKQALLEVAQAVLLSVVQTQVNSTFQALGPALNAGLNALFPGGGVNPTSGTAPATSSPGTFQQPGTPGTFSFEFGAKGGIMEQFPAFSGAVLDRPTSFGLGSRRVQGGEGGQEGLLPLAKMGDNTLGVRATFKDDESSKPVVVNQYISTPDRNSFNMAEREIASRLKRYVR